VIHGKCGQILVVFQYEISVLAMGFTCDASHTGGSMSLLSGQVGKVAIDPSFFPAPFRFRIGTKFKWDTPKVKKMLDDANRKSLKRAGRIVWSAARSPQVISSRAPLAKPKNFKLVERQGYQLYAKVDKIPKGNGLITSWKTPRNPEGFLRKSLEYDYSPASKTVVVGPGATRGYRVASLQAYGGTAKYYFKPLVGSGQKRYGKRVYGTLVNSQPMVGGRNGVPQLGVYSFTRQIKGKQYMERAVKIALAAGKIPEQWRNSLRHGGGA